METNCFGRSATGIPCLMKEFRVSLSYFDFDDSPSGIKSDVEKMIAASLVRNIGRTFYNFFFDPFLNLFDIILLLLIKITSDTQTKSITLFIAAVLLSHIHQFSVII